MSKRLDNLFNVCAKVTELKQELVELGMLAQAAKLSTYGQELYNDCLDVENAEAELGAD